MVFGINSSRIVNGKEIARIISNTTAIHSITNPTSECVIARVHNMYMLKHSRECYMKNKVQGAQPSTLFFI